MNTRNTKASHNTDHQALHVETYKKRLTELKAQRAPYEKIWKDLSEHIRPDLGLFKTVSHKSPKQVANTKKIYDGTATLAVRNLSSGMMAGVTSPARAWFKLSAATPNDQAQNAVQNKELVLWLQNVQRTMLDVFARSNIYNALHNMYNELIIFGSACMIIEQDEQDIIRAYPLTAGEYFFDVNERKEVDTLYRTLNLTVQQAVKRFGLENLSAHVKKQYQENKLHDVIHFTHVIEPNQNKNGQLEDAQHMPYHSVIFENSADKNQFASISGYRTFPAMCVRWSATAHDAYGYAPAMEALPDIKQLQHEQKKKAQAIDKKVSPPLQAPASMKHNAVNGLPGGVTFYDETRQQNGIKPTYEVNLSLSDLTEDIKDVQERIRKTFYEDLFLMLSGQRDKAMTAREVEERHEEKLLMLGPVLERLHNELLDPLIKRCFDIIKQLNLLPEMPENFEGQDVNVEYVSLMSQAQKAIDTSKIERFLEFLGKVQIMQPELMNSLELGEILKEVAQLMGLSQTTQQNIFKSEPSETIPDIQNIIPSLEQAAAQYNKQMQNMSQVNITEA